MFLVALAHAGNSPGCHKVNAGNGIGSGPARVGVLGTTAAEIHGKFASIIEGNFTTGNAPKIIEGMSNTELADLAALYGKATFHQTSPLLTILAEKLSAKELRRVASAFGSAPTSLAVELSSPASVGVAYYALPQLKSLSPSAPVAAATGPLTPAVSVFQTPYEIYLDFRTAPYGALGVTDALFETATYIGGYVSAAFGVGTYIGTDINEVIENYDPDLEIDIGGTVDSMAEDLAEAGNELSAGDIEDAMDSLFGTPLPQTPTDYGDFNITIDMAFFIGEAPC